MDKYTYRWESPFDWLNTASRQWDQDLLLQQFLLLASLVDSDTLQDLYQSDMDQDGYFEKIPNTNP